MTKLPSKNLLKRKVSHQEVNTSTRPTSIPRRQSSHRLAPSQKSYKVKPSHKSMSIAPKSTKRTTPTQHQEETRSGSAMFSPQLQAHQHFVSPQPFYQTLYQPTMHPPAPFMMPYYRPSVHSFYQYSQPFPQQPCYTPYQSFYSHSTAHYQPYYHTPPQYGLLQLPSGPTYEEACYESQSGQTSSFSSPSQQQTDHKPTQRATSRDNKILKAAAYFYKEANRQKQQRNKDEEIL